ncbi:hypothetical protein NHQ30_004268 [Ciborinia camelliae]|nr:hypothetical protein NHQ30_004268 [Ciborinia camelliae]
MSTNNASNNGSNNDSNEGSNGKINAQDTAVVPVSTVGETANLSINGVVPETSLPQNWSSMRKWLIVLASSLTSLMVSMTLVICAPASSAIAREFNNHNSFLLVFYITAPNLGQVFSSLYIGPLSERFGRVPVYHFFNILFLIFTLSTGFSTNLNILVVLRSLAGATIAPICLNPAISGDIFAAKKRGSAISIASLIPILGSAVGPIAGGYITEYLSWRWCFWLMAILSASVQPFLAIVLKESYLPVIRQKALEKSGYNTEIVKPPSKYFQGWNLDTAKALSLLIVRPFIILSSSRVAVLMALYLSILYAYLALLSVNMATIFQEVYGFSESQSGLIYIATTAGTLGGTIYCIFTLDYFFARGTTAPNRPENRLIPIIPAMIAYPIGLLVYGWSLQKHWHWIVPTLSTTLCGFSLASSTTPIINYLVDIFGDRAASAIAAVLPLRYIAGTFLPAAAPYMNSSLGYGWANSLLAFILLIVVPPIFQVIVQPQKKISPITVTR